jgi:hypothetical protein
VTLEEHLMRQIGAMAFEVARLAAKVDELAAKLAAAEPWVPVPQKPPTEQP